jgi:hypothetical protein
MGLLTVNPAGGTQLLPIQLTSNMPGLRRTSIDPGRVSGIGKDPNNGYSSRLSQHCSYDNPTTKCSANRVVNKCELTLSANCTTLRFIFAF